MAGILDFQNYLGGPDQVQVEQIFPSNSRTLVYNFNQDITGWTFITDYQTIVVDAVQFNRSTGKPNFANSTVIGTFPVETIAEPYAPEVIDQTIGTVKIHFPPNMYSGAIIPDARQNVPITVFSVTWTDDASPSQTSTHRWALVNCWESGVVAGDPTLETDYTPLVLGA